MGLAYVGEETPEVDKLEDEDNPEGRTQNSEPVSSKMLQLESFDSVYSVKLTQGCVLRPAYAPVRA